MLGYFVVSLVHRTLTWITGSLSYVCNIFAWESESKCLLSQYKFTRKFVYTRGTSVYSLIWRTFVAESAQNLTLEKSLSGRKAWHITVTRPFGDNDRVWLTLVFESEYSTPALRHRLSADFLLTLLSENTICAAYYYYYSWLLYSAILCSRANSLRTCVMWFWTSDCILFKRVLLISTEVVYWQPSLVLAWLVPSETAAVSAQVLCTPFNRAPVYSVTSFKVT